MSDEHPMQLIITDPLEIKQALAATDALGVIWDIDQELRSLSKESDTMDIQDLRDFIANAKFEHGINLDILYQ